MDLISDNKRFEIAMVVGTIFMEQYADKEPYMDYTADEECTCITVAVVDRIKDLEHYNDKTAIEGIIKEVIDEPAMGNMHNGSYLSDCYYGFICGEYLGMPDACSMEKAQKALAYFASHKEMGYLQEVFNECNYLKEAEEDIER